MKAKPKEPQPTDFPTALRAAREAAGLSQSQLARELGVESQTVSRWERGVAKPPLDTIVRLASALRVTAGKLMEETP
jgi:transcriptional regulator with XRE-family HTH domain